MQELMAQLGKEAAAYARSYILPPAKKATSRSRTLKVKPGQSAPSTDTEQADSQAQSPHRYGRRMISQGGQP